MNKRRAVIVIFHATLSPRHALMLRSLKRSGWNISAVAWDRPGHSSVPRGQRALVDQWQWIRVPAPALGGIHLITRLPRYYYQLLKAFARMNKPDLWILCHVSLLACAPFISGKKLYDAPEMYSIDMLFRFPIMRPILRPLLRIFEGFLVSRVDGILTVDSKGGWLERFYQGWNQNVQVIWNVPSRHDDPDIEEVKTLASEYSGQKVVAFIGGLKLEKGLAVAIKAAAVVKAKHPDVLFLLIGSIQGGRETIRRLIHVNRVENNIRLLNWMPYREMLAHLHHAKIGLGLHQRVAIYPFVSAGNGRKFFTYMQAGIPIIGPNFGEVGLVVKMADCGLLIDTKNVDEVSAVIIELLERPEKAECMGGNGRKAFLERFNWEKEEKKFLTFVELNTTW